MELVPFFIFLLMGLTLGGVLIGISLILGQRIKGTRKNDIYESGVDPVGSSIRRYDIKFYLTAILFLLFDVEIVFLFPWALYYNHAGKTLSNSFMLFEFAVFLGLLLVGYLFVVVSKALDWEK